MRYEGEKLKQAEKKIKSFKRNNDEVEKKAVELKSKKIKKNKIK